MEKLKLKNRQLEKENALLKSKMIEMSIFSRRMVEIAAKMDQPVEIWCVCRRGQRCSSFYRDECECSVFEKFTRRKTAES